ncbi:MAG: methylated-DNA--[protein]-cysteine S-methyltransferase [Clostridiales bacterium]|nr:methylated-DNA--[protein]-cysteine S-methyltransferase [Clostridiales bacterium]
MEHTYIYDTPIGKIRIAEDGNAITEIDLLSLEFPVSTIEMKETGLIRKAYEELMEYLNGRRKEFSVPLNPKGTDFQRNVWNVLQTIPYGETRSYGQVAVQAGNPKASRAVGMANNRNPILIMIPCHRVIGADGSLTGYGGGLDLKEHLLNLEREGVRRE